MDQFEYVLMQRILGDHIRWINSPSNDPVTNLAFERWALEEDVDERPLFYCYTNRPSIVIGRNQQLFAEVNVPFCDEQGIQICRRVSGGGTVYHDMGNLNIGLVMPKSLKLVNDYHFFLDWPRQALQRHGLDTVLNTRNAILCHGKKISGSAQFAGRNKLLTHCTLLVDSNLNHLEKSISSPLVTHSKALPSVRSEVVNLKSFGLSMESVINLLMAELQATFTTVDEEEVVADKLQSHKEILQSWDWVYGRSPKASIIYNGQEYIVSKGRLVDHDTLQGLAFDHFLREDLSSK
ncbi:MAG: lipoate--protein ligase family protein [Bacteroidota bacterium]|nr:lipoate--protein ligase family protein [Bacteroidota bacterium]MEC8757680.1 lipoate--protein ligase family protein [Bacteroidota bacterium]